MPSIVKPGALVTLAPSAVSVKTVFVLIFIPLLAAKSINSELVQLSVPSCHTNDLSPWFDFSIIPPPSTAASLPILPLLSIASSIFLSSTLKSCTSMDVVVPATTRLPSILTSPPTSKVY